MLLILNRLRQDGDLEDAIGPNFLVRNWPPALPEWSTKSVRDAFFASPQFPRLIKPDAVRHTIARGVEGGLLAYIGKPDDGTYAPLEWKTSISPLDIEVSTDMYIIKGKDAEAYQTALTAPPPPKPSELPEPPLAGTPAQPQAPGDTSRAGEPTDTEPPDDTEPDTLSKITWTGEVPPQKWMNFYTRVLTKFATSPGLTLTLTVEVAPPEGISKQKVEETKVALRELGLDDDVKDM